MVLRSDTSRNVVGYYLNFLVVAVVGFFINPLLLGALGPVMFGAWKSLQRFLDFATVTDGRASQALKWIVANRTTCSPNEKRQDIGATVIVWLRWLPLAALTAGSLTVAAPLLIRGIPDNAQAEVYMTAAILAANTVLAGLISIPDSVLTGVNQGYKSMLITTVVFVLSNGAMICAAFIHWPLWTLAAIVLIAGLVNAGLTLLVARASINWWGISKPTQNDVRRVFNYSAWTLGGALVDKLLLATELIVISVMIGAVSVTQYTFTTYVTQFVLSIALVTASGFMPVLGSQIGASDYREAATRATFVRHLVVGVISIGSAAVLAFNGAFVSLWVGSEQYMGTVVNALLVACCIQQALIRLDGQILDVTMRIAPKVLIGLLSTVGGIFCGCLVFSITHNVGYALIGILAVRMISNIAYPLLVARYIPHCNVPWRAVAVACLLLGFSFAIGPSIQSGSIALKLVLGITWVIASVIAAPLGLFPKRLTQALQRRLLNPIIRAE